eukprot:g3592.t1
MSEHNDSRSPDSGVAAVYDRDRRESLMRTDGAIDDLEDGAMVVMYFEPGILVVVKQSGKYWELERLSVPEDSEEEMTMHFYPSEAVFTVVRKGKYVGFKSIVAEGRTLQAVAAEEGAPLRVNNYNFGAWEMWEATGSGFVNRKWPQKMLNLKVCEIQTVSLANLRRLERLTLRTSRDLQTKIKTLEIQRHNLEREIGDLNRSKRRQVIQHTREIEDSRSRLDEALAAKQKFEVDSVQANTKLRRQDLVITQLTLQRDNANARLADIEAKQRSAERQQEAIKDKYENQILDMKRSHHKEIQALKTEKEHEIDRSISRMKEELYILQQKLEQSETDRERDVKRLQEEHENVLRHRAIERDQMREENGRLVHALQIIQQKVQNGFNALSREDFHQSFRPGCDDRLRSGNASPSLMQRFSPAPSRGSMRKGDDCPDNASQVERSIHSSEFVGNGYPDRVPLGHYDSFSTRSISDGQFQRRADSRTSDSSKFNVTNDELHSMSKRHPLDSRRQALHHQGEPNSARYSSQLVSIEDEDEQLCKEFKNKSYDVDTDGSRSIGDDLCDINEDQDDHATRIAYVSGRGGRGGNLTRVKKQEVLSSGDSETKTIDSESDAANGDNDSTTQPAELMMETDKRSDVSQSMVEEGVTPTRCLLADLRSEESVGSGDGSQQSDK